MTAPDYTADDLGRQIERWMRAAEAASTGSVDDAAMHLSGPYHRDNAAVYGDLITMVMVGACMVAGRLAEANGYQFGDPDVQLISEPVNPAVEAPADERLACDAVALAQATRMVELGDLVNAYAAPDEAGIARITAVAVHLLSMYVAVVKAVAS